MKKYVYLEKEDGVLITHHMTATNRQEVKEKTGACIDNIYSFNLLMRVNNWLLSSERLLAFSDNNSPLLFIGDSKHYIKSFVEFRNIVAEYRER